MLFLFYNTHWYWCFCSINRDYTVVISVLLLLKRSLHQLYRCFCSINRLHCNVILQAQDSSVFFYSHSLSLSFFLVFFFVNLVFAIILFCFQIYKVNRLFLLYYSDGEFKLLGAGHFQANCGIGMQLMLTSDMTS